MVITYGGMNIHLTDMVKRTHSFIGTYISCKIVGCLKLKITVWRYLKLCNNKLKDEKKKKGYNGVLFQGEEKCHFVFCVYF